MKIINSEKITRKQELCTQIKYNNKAANVKKELRIEEEKKKEKLKLSFCKNKYVNL